jgi:hypothetical protein
MLPSQYFILLMRRVCVFVRARTFAARCRLNSVFFPFPSGFWCQAFLLWSFPYKF